MFYRCLTVSSTSSIKTMTLQVFLILSLGSGVQVKNIVSLADLLHLSYLTGTFTLSTSSEYR